MAGPFDKPPFANLHCSPLGARLKPDNTARLIVDLSQPTKNCINEGIDKNEYRVHYEHFDTAIDIIKKLGPGCLLEKLDIKSAFRLLPVKPAEWHLLGLFWLGAYFIDCHLPMGCRASPFLFTVLSDLLAWIILKFTSNENITHYLDDYLFASVGTAEEAGQKLSAALQLLKFLNIPIALEKLVSPTTILVYLGIEIDTVLMEIRLPKEKIQALKALLPTWRSRKKCTKRQLLKLIGKLGFATKVVRPGRTFLRRLIDLSTTVKRLHHHIDITAAAQKDIEWWSNFMTTWNGSSIMLDRHTSNNFTLNLYTDASDMGYGIYYNGKWTSEKWPPKISKNLKLYSIDWREMFAIYVAIWMYAFDFKGRKILFYCDNLPITQAWNKGSSKSPMLMSLIRNILMKAAVNNFSISLQHLPQSKNVEADLLSKLEITAFLESTGAKYEDRKTPRKDIWNWEHSMY